MYEKSFAIPEFLEGTTRLLMEAIAQRSLTGLTAREVAMPFDVPSGFAKVIVLALGSDAVGFGEAI